jgi:tRNA A-37 threonylcarbamoyl transferase component Bud32
MDRTGQIIGDKYRLVRLLGTGGMGAVYEAQHQLIGRRCAVKFLHPELARQHDLVTRFVREAQAASAIGHRGIIDIYDVGTTPDGMPYLVMEFLDGESVGRRLMQTGVLPVGTAVEIVAQVLSALHLAHQRGIVHRDLKPDNLYLVQSPGSPMVVKILDFGISKMTGGADDQRVTRTGAVLGTPVYMAPEQAAGQPDIDHRLDVYAMGVILFELLTGRVPFTGTNYNQILFTILSAPFPSARSVNPEIPAGLEQVVFKATVRNRERRFPDAGAMLQALLPFLDAAARARLGIGQDDAARTTERLPPAAPVSAAADTALVGLTQPTAAVAAPSRRTPAALAAAAATVAALTVALLLWAPWSGSNGSTGSSASVRPEQVVDGSSPAVVGAGTRVGAASLPSAAAAPPRAAASPAAADAGGDDGLATVGSPAAAPDAAGLPPAAVPPLPADAVTIALSGLPEGAVVLYDGAEVAQVPFQVPRSSVTVVLEVRAPGFRPYRNRVTPSRDVSLTPQLRRLPSGTGASAAATPPVGPETPPVDAGTTVRGGRGTEIHTIFE